MKRKMNQKTNREEEHEDVYGRSFALYNADEMAQFTDYFRQRFAANGLDPKAIFSGRRCLDAGCGGGRGTLFMLGNGAAQVTAVDVSAQNVETTAHNCRTFGYESYKCLQTTLERLPFADGEFDFVWCNGVLMHAANPDACLSEITRVLKVGGDAWIYVYGAGGLYWYLVREFREILSSVSSPQLLAMLQLARLPVRYVGEYMDDWKVPYLRTYTAAEFSNRLRDLGYSSPKPLPRGVTYDTSERRTAFPEDAPWYGEGDLRYLLTKGPTRPNHASVLGNNSLAIMDRYAPEVTERFRPLTRSLQDLASRNLVLGALACASIQRYLRDTLSKPGPLDLVDFEHGCKSVMEQLRAAVGSDAAHSGHE
jgi:ubiquinone/menaquinone biosynthesis C-methylase UbiE